MENTNPAGLVMPNYRIPKVLGILNILFASGLLLCGLCMNGYLLMIPSFMSMAEGLQKDVQVKADEQKKATIKGLQEEEAAASNEDEKADIKARRLSLESAPKPVMPTMDFNKMGMEDTRWVGFVLADLITGLLVNLLVLISGIGLVQFKSWGRTLGLWGAVLKIARLVVLYSFMILVLSPFFSKKMGEAVGDMVVQQQQAMGRPAAAAPPTRDLVRVYGVMTTVFSVGMIVIGSIYPAISIWLLTRPGARAACSGLKPAPGTSETW